MDTDSTPHRQTDLLGTFRMGVWNPPGDDRRQGPGEGGTGKNDTLETLSDQRPRGGKGWGKHYERTNEISAPRSNSTRFLNEFLQSSFTHDIFFGNP